MSCEGGSGRAGLRNAAGAALIALATFLAYGPALHGGFVWDDDAYVTDNPLLTEPDGWRRIWFSAHTQSQYFPLVFTTLRLERAVFGLDPFGYHVVNVALHVANALLAWLVLARLALPGAWLAAALFALHPVQVESVAWITELKNTQSTFFSLLALLAWMRFTEGAGRGAALYALSLALYGLALLSKTTACTLPAALLLVLWLRGQRLDLRRVVQVAPFLGLGVAMGLLSIAWEAHLGNYEEKYGVGLSWPERFLVASRALWFYLGKLVWPADLAFSYPRWELEPASPLQWSWALLCVALVAALWRWRAASGRGPFAAAAFFVATLSPLLGFFPSFTFYYSFVADHYQYFACLGPLALVAAGLARLASLRPAAGRTLAAGVLAALGALSWQQAHAYQSHEALWRDTLAKNPGSWMAHNNLGQLLRQRGALAEAEAHTRKSIALNPNNGEAQYNLACLLFAAGRVEAAVVHYREALRFHPGRAHYHHDLGAALASLGRSDEAIAAYREALRLDPSLVLSRAHLARALEQRGERAAAAAEYAEVLRREPGHAFAAARLRELGAEGAAGPPEP